MDEMKKNKKPFRRETFTGVRKKNINAIGTEIIGPTNNMYQQEKSVALKATDFLITSPVLFTAKYPLPHVMVHMKSFHRPLQI